MLYYYCVVIFKIITQINAILAYHIGIIHLVGSVHLHMLKIQKLNSEYRISPCLGAKNKVNTY